MTQPVATCKRILVNLGTSHNGKGVAMLGREGQCVQDVVRRYSDGRVRTSSGDVWHTMPYEKDGIDYVVDRAAELAWERTHG